MKTTLLALSLLFAGCQTAPRLPKPAPDPLPLRGRPGAYAGPAHAEPPPDTRNDDSTRQLVAALVTQNEALTARLQALESEAKAPASATKPAPATAPGTVAPATLPSVGGVAPPVAAAPTPPAPIAGGADAAPADVPLLVPNADGVIDLTALDAPVPGSPPNPFAVRALPADAVREISLDVQGILTGATPCALVGGQVVEPGGTVETLRLARLDPDALVLSGDGFDLRLPFGATKVRLAR